MYGAKQIRLLKCTSLPAGNHFLFIDNLMTHCPAQRVDKITFLFTAVCSDILCDLYPHFIFLLPHTLICQITAEITRLALDIDLCS